MSPIALARWTLPGEPPDAFPPDLLLDRGGDVPADLAGICVVAPRAYAGRLDALIGAGAQEVLVGEAALRDPRLVRDGLERHGAGRIGIWLPVRLTQTRWSLDRHSNADFSFVSIPTPIRRWVVLRSDGTASEVDALWWAGEQLKAGCSRILLSIPEPQDDDLLPTAELAELAGERLWLDTGSADPAELRFWVKYGHAHRLVLPPGSDLGKAMAGLNALFPAAEELPA